MKTLRQRDAEIWNIAPCSFNIKNGSLRLPQISNVSNNSDMYFHKKRCPAIPKNGMCFSSFKNPERSNP
ncbi:unnamed protein product [Gordionus sp. m RMFG-2023]